MSESSTSLPLEAQHTPGPWKVTANPEVNRGDRFRAFEISSSSSDCWLAYVQEHVGPGSGAANARLIASAPALLEALRKLVHVVPGIPIDWNALGAGAVALETRGAIAIAEKAILAAEGKPCGK